MKIALRNQLRKAIFMLLFLGRDNYFGNFHPCFIGLSEAPSPQFFWQFWLATFEKCNCKKQIEPRSNRWLRRWDKTV
jgi:hypothetical protein